MTDRTDERRRRHRTVQVHIGPGHGTQFLGPRTGQDRQVDVGIHHRHRIGFLQHSHRLRQGQRLRRPTRPNCCRSLAQFGHVPMHQPPRHRPPQNLPQQRQDALQTRPGQDRRALLATTGPHPPGSDPPIAAPPGPGRYGSTPERSDFRPWPDSGSATRSPATPERPRPPARALRTLVCASALVRPVTFRRAEKSRGPPVDGTPY